MIASPVSTSDPEVSTAVPPPPSDVDQRVILHGVSFREYCDLRERFDSPGVRMTYFEGALEIMSPSRKHEDIKTRIARLLEVFALERNIPLYGYGSTTFKDEPNERGLEPDECYGVRRDMGDAPDLAIEVVVTHGGIGKREIYRTLGVRELWTWRSGAIAVHVLAGDAYEARERSEVLPEVDLEALARFAAEPDQHAAVMGYRDLLRGAAAL